MKLGTLRTPLMFVVLGWMWLAPRECFAQWTKSIECPAGRVYRDVRIDGGRDEFCELALPGALSVQDGPERWWSSEGHLGGEGSYRNGRQVGRWKKCDRFDRCRYESYELITSQERVRGTKPEIPVSFARGKFTFDFGACWGTWITRHTADSFLELNIADGLIRCQVIYIPSSDKDKRGRGSLGHYLCEIPYSLGVRQFDSLDLRKELPKAGLPQFCGQDFPPVSATMPDGNAAQAFSIWGKESFIDKRSKSEARVWTTLANVVDVECAAISSVRPGTEQLTVRLNEYAERLILDRVGRDELKVDACGGRFPLSPVDELSDSSGRTLFVYGLSRDQVTAAHQRRCIANQIALRRSCASQ